MKFLLYRRRNDGVLCEPVIFLSKIAVRFTFKELLEKQ